MKLVLIVLILATIVRTNFARRPQSFRIGSLFLPPDTIIHNSFAQVVSDLNKDQEILNGTRVDQHIEYVTDDPLDVYQKICMEMSNRVVAMFSSSLPLTDRTAGSVCNSLRIPYITTTMASPNLPKTEYILHLGPTQLDMIQVVVEVVTRLGWQEVAFVTHRDSESLDPYYLTEMLQRQNIRVQLLNLKHSDIRPDVAALRRLGFQNYIVDISSEYLALFFDQAMKSGVVHSGSAFLPVTLDLTKVPMDSIRHTGATIIGLSIVNKESLKAKKDFGEISKELAANILDQYRVALIYDGVRLFAKAVEILVDETDLSTPEVGCDDFNKHFELGENLLRKISQVSHEGLTGFLSLKNGLRQHVDISIIKLNVTGDFYKIGHWKMDFGQGSQLVLNEMSADQPSQALRLTSEPLKVQTIVSNYPYVMKTDENQYEGILIDVLAKLAEDVGFDYKIQENSMYGRVDETHGNWTGLIGSLVNKEADIALADLTVNGARAMAVDFAPAFETLSITILTRKTSDQDFLGSSLINFLNTFTVQMWMAILVAYVLTSLLMFVIGRLSPYERKKKETAHLSLLNSFWFILAGFLHRTTPNVQPKSVSARFLTSFWWIFCLIVLILYIVSLATAVMTHAGPRPLQDIIESDDFQLTLPLQGSTARLLQTSKDPMMKSLWNKVKKSTPADSEQQISSLSEAISALNSGATNLGFIIESSFADFATAENCDLTTVGQFGSRHHALAFPKNSPYKDEISRQLLEYIDDGTIAQIKQKWIQKISVCPPDVGSSQSRHNPNVYSILGPFLLLLVAGLVALLMAFAELLIFAKRSSPRRGTFSSILKSELSKATSCSTSKPEQNLDRYGSVPSGLNGNGVNSARHGKAINGSDQKRGNYLQTQALLRKDDDINSQL